MVKTAVPGDISFLRGGFAFGRQRPVPVNF